MSRLSGHPFFCGRGLGWLAGDWEESCELESSDIGAILEHQALLACMRSVEEAALWLCKRLKEVRDFSVGCCHEPLLLGEGETAASGCEDVKR